MGGAGSKHYREFRRYCCSAFNILRKHAPLILNLLSLMGDANIPNLSNDLDKHMVKVQEKFRLDLDDEQVCFGVCVCVCLCVCVCCLLYTSPSPRD